MFARLVVACLTAAAISPALVAEPAHSHPHEMPASSPTKAPIFDLGKWHHAVTTTSPEAQLYFDQGLNLTYGFNHAQAIIAFEQAAQLDSSCAMAYWGKALALGPNINWPMDPSAEGPAWQAVQKALTLAPGASEPERAYILALAKRYADPAMANRPARAALDSAYANAMRVVAKRYPADTDAATLFAESMMDLNPWNQWTGDGQPTPGTDEILATLEGALTLAPLNPGANHFYIHSIEASKHPERAVPAAERLTNLVPDAGHLVHMPGHIWNRVGRYAQSEDANVRAARIDSLYIATYAPQGVYPMMYYPHNMQFIWSAACFEGHSAAALGAAKRLETMVTLDMIHMLPPAESVCPTTFITYVRFGLWDDVLRTPAPIAELRYTTGMWHYARGLAFAASGRLAQAAAERESLAAIAATLPLEAIMGFNPAPTLLGIAGHSLAGEIAVKRGRVDDAVRELRAGAAVEDGLHYDEPPDWSLPVRQELGAVLLAAGRVKEAEAAYRDDLSRNPENGWSLFGLTKCLRARKADAEAAEVEKRFAKAWARGDVKLTASRF